MNISASLWHCIQHVLALSDEQQQTARELLILDMLTFFRFRYRLDFLGWEEAPRSETDAIFRDEAWLRQYVPDYAFTSWRDIKMRYRIWRVSQRAMQELQQYTAIPAQAAYILAEKRNHDITWQMIPEKN